jgi:hypothetical protein
MSHQRSVSAATVESDMWCLVVARQMIAALND